MSDEIDFDVDPLGGGHYDPIPTTYLQPSLGPRSFACMVCNLQLYGSQELAEAGLPSRYFDVTREDLGPNFDLGRHIDAFHGDD
jgi:hypothetical protein